MSLNRKSELPLFEVYKRDPSSFLDVKYNYLHIHVDEFNKDKGEKMSEYLGWCPGKEKKNLWLSYKKQG